MVAAFLTKERESIPCFSRSLCPHSSSAALFSYGMRKTVSLLLGAGKRVVLVDPFSDSAG